MDELTTSSPTFAYGPATAREPFTAKWCPADGVGAADGIAAPAASDRGLSFPEVQAKVASAHAAAPEPSAAAAKPERHLSLWENEEFGFHDLIDIVNPLQHIPIVATLYRHMTGEKIGAVPRVIGGALWGRLGGFISGLVNAVVDWLTGKDIGDHIYAALFGDKADSKEDAVAAQSKRPSFALSNAAAPSEPSAAPPAVLPADADEKAAPSSEMRLPLSSAAPGLFPHGIQPLASSYLRGRKPFNDENSPRLYLTV